MTRNRCSKAWRSLAVAAIATALATGGAHAQISLFELPQASPHARVLQRVGLTDITIDYHRPGVKGRRIWGSLVPWDQVWRAGANENTTIEFSTPVSILGHRLEAGTYGLHMIPSKPYWTVIFSTAYKSWGSFTYDPAEDALRIQVMPRKAPFQERLEYRFEDLDDYGCTVVMHWERVEIAWRVDVDTKTIVVEHLREGLRGLPRFTWRGWEEAARWCARNDVNLEEAMTWIDRSIAEKPTFSNRMVKAELLDDLGRHDEAEHLREEAILLAPVDEVLDYGSQMIFDGLVDEAVRIYRQAVKLYPDAWYTHAALADAWERKGERGKAKKEYEAALRVAQDPKRREELRRILRERF